MSNTPQIRFDGFTDDWEQRELGAFADIVTGKLDANAMKEDGEYDFYTSGIQKYKIDVPAFEGPAITIAGNGATVGYMHLADGKFNAYQRTYVLSAFQANREFLFYEIGNKLPQKIAQEARTGNIPYIVMDMLTDLQISISSEQEQRKIGEYFYNLDNLITLHQRKCDALQKFKKSMLQKMFPRNGESVPEIRFAGFTDAWEQRELSEISDKVSKKNQDIVVDEVFTNSAEYGIISQRDYFDKDIANSENIDGYYIVEPNDFVYNPRISTLAPFGPIRRNKLEKSGAMSPLYYVFRTHDVDYGFLEYYFKTNGWHSFMHLNGNSGARSDRFAIRDEIFKEMPITMPQDIDEQKKIGDFFTTLEMAVTLHQRKLETLRKMKKSLLQKMFPPAGRAGV